MKEDVLEQVVDDYLQGLGFLTRSNVRFRPSASHPAYNAQQDSGWSDIDVIGYSPTRYGADRVWVVSCKSWQTGLDPGGRLDQLRAGKEWQVHRELWVPKWGQALCDTVERLTGQRTFRFFTAVTKLKGQVDRWHEWQQEPRILEALDANWVGFLRLEDMWARTLATSTTTLAGSVMGRLAQMLLAAGQATMQPVTADLDPELTLPHQQADQAYPSLGGMWLAPPAASDCYHVSLYGNTLLGCQYANRHYGVEASPEGLLRLVQASPRWSERSFELLRLEQFYEVRSWHHGGYVPEHGEDFDKAMTLHHEVQRAWADRRFDRADVPPRP